MYPRVNHSKEQQHQQREYNTRSSQLEAVRHAGPTTVGPSEPSLCSSKDGSTNGSPAVPAFPYVQTAHTSHHLEDVEKSRLGLSPRHGRSNNGNSFASPLGVAAAALAPTQRVIWNPRKPPNPFSPRFSILAFILFLLFLGACGYYFYVRIAFTLNMGNHTWYGIVILVGELMGLSAVLPYGFMLFRYTASKGSRGLPIDDGKVILPVDKRFHVRVLIPCYKESMDVIMNTMTAALSAEVPPGANRTVYLCDDGKDPKKKEWVDGLGKNAVYVSGRTRARGEINGKSANVNNCLKNVIYPEFAGKLQDIPMTEVIVVFDADMAAKRNFFLKVLEAMWDNECSLCLTPQAFSNINPKADIFNNINQQFWEYVLPGCDAWGYIACTGTNFCLRARSLAAVGWFPEYTITEDYALSMELKSAGFKGRYLAEYLAVGEAPDEIRNVCRQRSRWTKGHMQIFFSKRCPLTNWRLPFLHKLLYTNGTWAYFCTIATTVVFVMVPFNSLVFGYHPVTFSRNFAIAATIYMPINVLLMNYVRKPQHSKGQWMANVSNHILCFTYMKAVVNTVLSKLGVKEKAGFKATDKSGTAPSKPIAAMRQLGSTITGIVRSASGTLQQNGLPTATPPLAAAAVAAQQASQQSSARVPAPGIPYGGGMGQVRTGTATASAPRPVPRSSASKKKKPARRGCWLWINAKTLEGALDPLFLALSMAISLAALGAGIYTIIRSKSFDFTVSSWNDFTQVFSSGRLDVYILVPMLWAMYNLIPPLLFFVYFFTKGKLLQVLCTVMQVLGLVLAIVAVAALWLMVPNEYDLKATLAPVADFLETAKSGNLPAAATLAYPWLQNPSDLGPASEPLRGGFYMADDYVKYSFPMASATAVLAWAVMEFPQGFAAAGRMQAVKDSVRWGADYLMAAHRNNSFVVQVGDPSDYLVDLETGAGSWGKPVDMPRNRTVVAVNRDSRGGADAVAAAAAALAATSLVFADEPAYSRTAQTHARQLYELATQMQPLNSSYCNVVPCFEGLVTGGYRWKAFLADSVYDDVAWAAGWLYKSTGQQSFATDASYFLKLHQQVEARPADPAYYVANYNNMVWPTYVLLAEGEVEERAQAAQFIRGWITGKNDASNVMYTTPRGLSYTGDEPLPNAAFASFLSLVYLKHNEKRHNSFVRTNMECFALQQVHYMLGGTMGVGRSFVVGVGSKYPMRPQHRQASCPADPNVFCNVNVALLNPEPNPFVLTGALVAGPDDKDRYLDGRVGGQSKVGVHYNVPLLGTLSGLIVRQVEQRQCQKEQGWYQNVFLDFGPR